MGISPIRFMTRDSDMLRRRPSCPRSSYMDVIPMCAVAVVFFDLVVTPLRRPLSAGMGSESSTVVESRLLLPGSGAPLGHLRCPIVGVGTRASKYRQLTLCMNRSTLNCRIKSVPSVMVQLLTVEMPALPTSLRLGGPQKIWAYITAND